MAFWPHNMGWPQHEDLYWALSGGGGGTFAVMLSMTVRVYAEAPAAAAMLSFTAAPTSKEAAMSEAPNQARFRLFMHTSLLDTLPLLNAGGRPACSADSGRSS
ncbi:hypothetical protein ASPACDRAFT_46697 [Aspergillus aculeatus ATCC 16872]|uniref:Uncharacterized protein n=1 Tax=Aspergillus aculeatus (strain ATCC 16872 / CBS 172.66 / WB 5094) TaxID=690307 RepID=A0A1L9WK48_ASPA1|nr:uncharacterized protein ASPACDRAFT_46697 [Aspergillus aculeatus ATCC 16872]OJJ96529.1 hypothetical protein ASPACDRAFT_46697 [Aspergillus aculeatus ATCC 16872]